MTPAQLRALRRRLGLSQSQLAQALCDAHLTLRMGDVREVRPQNISDWEHGRKSPDRIAQLAIQTVAESSGRE
jgi:DNA-binding transcriptional regulator YiaG